MAQWNRITEVKPKPDQQVLVNYREDFLVSHVNFYDEVRRAEYASWVTSPPPFMQNITEKDKKHYLECEGYFEEFGQKYYFDNPEVYWQELPRKPSPEGDYWEDQKKQPDFNNWMENLHGSILCNCGHGCRSWIADNGAKAYKIIEALLPALGDKTNLDEIVKKHTDDVGAEIWNERIKRSENE